MDDVTYLTGHLLIAMPSMADPNFIRTVTYVCEHNDEGALGIIVNRPLEMALAEVFQQLALDGADPALAKQTVVRGGPVQTERGFVLHDPSGEWDSTVAVSALRYVGAARIHSRTFPFCVSSLAGQLLLSNRRTQSLSLPSMVIGE